MCNDFVNSNGYGKCKKESPTSKHQGGKMCYVFQPSNCTDLVDSGTDPGEQYSAVACGNTVLNYI